MSDNRTTELLPCPFCGGEAKLMHMDLDSIEEGWQVWGVWCMDDMHAEDSGGYQHGHFIDNFATEAEAIAAWNTRAAHGTLTAEQIGEAIERNFMKICVLDDGKPVEWREDWVCRVGIDYKAIADELNAALGSGECEVEYVDEWMGWHCKSCDTIWQGLHDQKPSFCMRCGKKVKR